MLAVRLDLAHRRNSGERASAARRADRGVIAFKRRGNGRFQRGQIGDFGIVEIDQNRSGIELKVLEGFVAYCGNRCLHPLCVICVELEIEIHDLDFRLTLDGHVLRQRRARAKADRAVSCSHPAGRAHGLGRCFVCGLPGHGTGPARQNSQKHIALLGPERKGQAAGEPGGP